MEKEIETPQKEETVEKETETQQNDESNTDALLSKINTTLEAILAHLSSPATVEAEPSSPATVEAEPPAQLSLEEELAKYIN